MAVKKAILDKMFQDHTKLVTEIRFLQQKDPEHLEKIKASVYGTVYSKLQGKLWAYLTFQLDDLLDEKIDQILVVFPETHVLNVVERLSMQMLVSDIEFNVPELEAKVTTTDSHFAIITTRKFIAS